MLRVMLVDDEPFILQGLKILVDWNKEGFDIVYTASNGKEALEYLKNNEVDLIISDIQMPVMNGLELLENIQKTGVSHARFAILTGYDDFSYAQRAIKYNSMDYILKPVQKKDILALLRNVSKLEKVSKEKEIGVSSVLLPAFSNMSDAERAYAPKMELSAEELTFEFGSKSKRKGEITITNTGKTTLKITSLQMFTDGLKVTLGKSELKPGKKTTLKITGYKKELSQVRTRPRVLMITNDPNRPKVVITVNVK